jgi:hypothetical protein
MNEEKKMHEKMSRHYRRYESMKCLYILSLDWFNKCFNLGYGWSRWLLSALLSLFFFSLTIDHFRIEHHSFISNDDHRQKMRECRCSSRQNQKKEKEEKKFRSNEEHERLTNDNRVVCTIIIDKKNRIHNENFLFPLTYLMISKYNI